MQGKEYIKQQDLEKAKILGLFNPMAEIEEKLKLEREAEQALKKQQLKETQRPEEEMKEEFSAPIVVRPRTRLLDNLDSDEAQLLSR